MNDSSETMENIALINNLPDDCLRKIFSFLPIEERPEIEKVCKRWRIVGERGWNDMKELKIHEDYSDNLIYVILKRCGRFLRKLIIDHSPWHLRNCLSMVIEFCQLNELEEIEISHILCYKRVTALAIPPLREIFEKSVKLRAVTITGRFDRDLLDSLYFLNLKTLWKLDLRNRNCTSTSINPDRFPNLKELRLQELNIIEDEMIREEESLKSLEKMAIYDCEMDQNFIQRICTFTNLKELRYSLTEIKDEDIRHIAEHCDKIEVLHLRNDATPTSNCFKYLGQMQSLKILELEYFSMNTRHLTYLTNVKTLIFHACHDILQGDGLIELIVNSSNLEELRLADIIGMTRSFLNNIGRIFQRGQREKYLWVLVLGQDTEKFEGLMKIILDSVLEMVIDIDALESDSDDSS